jgi:hypothetical protein
MGRPFTRESYYDMMHVIVKAPSNRATRISASWPPDSIASDSPSVSHGAPIVE